MPDLAQLAAVFNEWAKRYADDPKGFSEILGPDGRPVTDYGEQCAIYFTDLAGEMGRRATPPPPA